MEEMAVASVSPNGLLAGREAGGNGVVEGVGT